MSELDPPTSAPAGCTGRGLPSMAVPAADSAIRLPGVLIVDDDDGVRQVLAAGLRHQGFAVWQAADCGEAVELYQAHHTSIGVVLLDVWMPGWDGPTTLAALQKFDPHVRACFLTGDAGRYTERDLLDLGALVVYRKPPRMSELAEQFAGMATR